MNADDRAVRQKVRDFLHRSDIDWRVDSRCTKFETFKVTIIDRVHRVQFFHDTLRFDYFNTFTGERGHWVNIDNILFNDIDEGTDLSGIINIDIYTLESIDSDIYFNRLGYTV